MYSTRISAGVQVERVVSAHADVNGWALYLRHGSARRSLK
jgi:hypothetical protein